MEWLFKLCGSVMVVAASFTAGYMKSYELRQRRRRLADLCRGLTSLKERIRMGGGEIERLVTESFKNGLIKADGGFSVDGRWLDEKDVALIYEYLTDIGMTDSESEYNRTELYIKLLSKNRDEAEEKCVELCRVYNAAGLLGGIFICIFFL